jgi:hypothetical protein
LKVEKANGFVATSFEEIYEVVVDNFKSCFSANERANIVEVIKMTYHFHGFVEEEDNLTLLEEFSKEAL